MFTSNPNVAIEDGVRHTGGGRARSLRATLLGSGIFGSPAEPDLSRTG